jgi:hypothetical protein
MVLWGAVAALVILGVGWVWGSSGRWSAAAAEQEARLHLHLAEARGALALARVDLFELNYGQASRHLQEGKDSLEDAAAILEKNRPSQAEVVRNAIARTVEAQQRAASVDTSANERAAEALRLLDRAAGVQPAK